METEVDADQKNSAQEEMDNYQPINQQSGKKKFIITLIFLGVIIFLVYFAVSMFLGSSKKGETTKLEDSLLESPSPTPTPEETLDRSAWPLEVLNGSGVSGLAKKVADGLRALGYQVVKTGNADRDNYTQSQILVKSDLSERVNLVIADIKDIVKIASVGGELKDSTASARIIIGKD